jgi:transcriptional regulator with XRE-family HTH domain
LDLYEFYYKAQHIIQLRFILLLIREQIDAVRGSNKMDFSDRLRFLRQKHKLTQGELAGVIGIKSSAIANYESQRNEPSFSKLIALSNYFKVSCDYMLGVSDNSLRIGYGDFVNETADFIKKYNLLSPAGKEDVLEYVNYLLYKQEQYKQDLNG